MAELEKSIAELEQQLGACNDELSRAEVYDDATRRDSLLRDVTRIQAELQSAMDRWAETNEALEELQRELGADG